MQKSVLACSVLAVGFMMSPGLGYAQDSYPSQVIRLIVPFPAGGGIDMVARTLADELGGRLGQSIIVENMPGAGSTIGAHAAAISDPDGYTLLMASDSLTANSVLNDNLLFDVSTDLVPVALVAEAPIVIAVHPSVPFIDFEGFIEYARENPGELSYGSPGIGSIHHFAMEVALAESGVDVLHIPYAGVAAAMTDALGGHVPMIVAAPGPLLPNLDSGALVAIAQTGAERIDTLSNVPTVSETIADFDIAIWNGVFVPAGVPEDIVQRLTAEIEQVVSSETFRDALARSGFTAEFSGPDDLADIVASDLIAWAEAADRLVLTPQ